MGLRSGLLPGQSSTSVLLSANHFMHLWATRHGALSCWKIYLFPDPNRSRADGNIFGWRMLEMYFTPLMVPSAIWIRPTPVIAMQPHIMTLTGCLMVAVVHSGMLSSHGRRHTYRTPSLPNIEILVSSLQRTFFQSSVVHWRCSFAQVRRFLCCFSFRYGLFLSILALSPALTSRRRTVRSDTLTSESWSMVLVWFAADFLFLRASLTILLSVFSLVHFFLPLLFAVVTVFDPSNRWDSLLMLNGVAPPPILSGGCTLRTQCNNNGTLLWWPIQPLYRWHHRCLQHK